MKILKFGGTSVKDAQAMQKVAGILKNYSEPVIVVLSATAGTTNTLLEKIRLASHDEMSEMSEIKKEMERKHRELVKSLGLEGNETLQKRMKEYFERIKVFLLGINYLREITLRASDAIVSNGELLSTTIFATYLEKQQFKSTWFDIREVMKTDSQFGAAIPQKRELAAHCEVKLKPLIAEYDIIVTQGFIGSSPEGLTTTLGRGGSDYTASLLGNVLEAEAIEIWTDVSGIMTADPRIVENVYTQSALSFKEAAELAYFGAKVLHPSTILPAMEKKIPVIVRNTHAPEDEGTSITFKCLKPKVCKAISFRSKIMILTVESSRMLNAYGFLEKIFDVFARNRIVVDLISTTEISVSLTVDESQYNQKIINELNEFANVQVIDNMAIISMVGEELRDAPNFMGKVFNSLQDFSIEMITFGTSNVNLSLVVPNDQLNNAVAVLHKALFE